MTGAHDVQWSESGSAVDTKPILTSTTRWQTTELFAALIILLVCNFEKHTKNQLSQRPHNIPHHLQILRFNKVNKPFPICHKDGQVLYIKSNIQWCQQLMVQSSVGNLATPNGIVPFRLKPEIQENHRNILNSREVINKMILNVT